MKNLVKKIAFFFVDLLFATIAPVIAGIAKVQVRLGNHRLPIAHKVWDVFSVLPVRYHYYQPIFKVTNLPSTTWTREDKLSGINMDGDSQLSLLNQFNYNSELESIPIHCSKEIEQNLTFYFNNNAFCSGDAEILYNVIRCFKPEKMIEVGSGFSTRLAKQALDRNRAEGTLSEHICIEPYEMPWLEKLGIDNVIRKRVEDLPLATFQGLNENDILFIDSSHVIRTGGDVLFLYLQVLPILKPGVLIHIHDIFLPFEYPRDFLLKDKWFWTEQYLLQSFLIFNSKFQVLLGNNWLHKHYKKEFDRVCPIFSKQADRIPGSFWIRRNKS